MQINRLFEIVYILMNKKAVTAKELAEYFGVSRRTICRDIETLSIAGIPIYTERGRGGGVRLLPNFVLNKSTLNEWEQNEILSALHSLSNIKTEHTSEVLQKLSSLFGKSTESWLEIDFTGWSHENDHFNLLKTAITERRMIHFDYYNRQGDKTFRRVEPLQIWFKSKTWYLKGFCLTKQDMRLYKLSCIKNLILTDEIFSLRDSLILSGNPIESIFEKNRVIPLKLHIAPEKAYRVFEDFYEGMVKKQPDGSFIVTVSWPEDSWLYGFILSYGSDIEVLEPEHLRTTIKK